MDDFSILIGGKAGFGIDKSGLIIAHILNGLGYRIYIYRDYPSLIRGGHTFSIIRVSQDKIATHYNKVDFLLALNQDTLNFHRNRLKKDCLFIYDSEQVKIDADFACGTGLPIGKILKEENAPEVMRNTCIIAAFCKAVGIDLEILEGIFKKRDFQRNRFEFKSCPPRFSRGQRINQDRAFKPEKATFAFWKSGHKPRSYQRRA